LNVPNPPGERYTAYTPYKQALYGATGKRREAASALDTYITPKKKVGHCLPAYDFTYDSYIHVTALTNSSGVPSNH